MLLIIIKLIKDSEYFITKLYVAIITIRNYSKIVKKKKNVVMSD